MALYRARSSLRTGGSNGRSARGSHSHFQEDEDEKIPNFLTTDKETEKLFTVMCNYLSLAQFELGRSVIDELFELSPDRVMHILRSLVLSKIPSKWLFSETVPSGAHLAWLGLVEYQTLHKRLTDPNVSDPLDVDELRSKYAASSVNPLGFVSHDRISVQVLEASKLKVFDKDEYDNRPPQGFVVHMRLEKHNYETPRATDPATPKWDNAVFSGDVSFADSKIEFLVSAVRTERGSSSVSLDPIGRCTLPLHQLRKKLEYHIRIPMESPEVDDDDVDNPFQLERRRGTGLSQVAKYQYGSLRVKVTWGHVDESFSAGQFPFRLSQGLEMDLLIANALYNGRKAYHARVKGAPHSTANVNDVLTALGRGTPLLGGHLDDVSINGGEIPTNSPVLSKKTVAALRQYAALLLSPPDDDNPLTQIAMQQQSPDTFLSDSSIFSELRGVIRALPSTGHAIAGKITTMARRGPLSSKFKFDLIPGASKMQSFYAQLIGEMMLRNEFTMAMQALYTFSHSISVMPRADDTMGSVLYAVVQCIHHSAAMVGSAEAERQRVDSLVSLIRSNDAAGLKNQILEEATGFQRQYAQELKRHQLRDEVWIRQYHERLLHQVQAYSALIGTSNEHALRTLGKLEDDYIYGDAEFKDPKDAPPYFFQQLSAHLDSIDDLLIANQIRPEEAQRQQQQCLVTFFAQFYSFVRHQNIHMLEYVIRRALGFCKGRNWKHVAEMIRPFNQLRPLVLLLAWDEFADDFSGREELVVNLWREQPAFPNDPCSEPRLTQWCNRLDFNVQLINIVLDDYAKTKNVKLRPAERNDRAIRLLDTLRMHSILYSFRDYLPPLHPTVLLTLLGENTTQGRHGSRGAECEHDLHVLRSYYAIRSSLGLILKDLVEPAVKVEYAATGDVLPQQESKYSDSDSDDNEHGRAVDVDIDDAAVVALEDVDTIEAKRASGVSIARAIEGYLLGMNIVDFQVTTLEKMFSLIFLQKRDLMTQEEKDRVDAEQEDARARRKEAEEAEMEAAASAHSTRNTELDDMSLIEDPEVKLDDPIKRPLLLSAETCQIMLFMIRELISKVKQQVRSIHSSINDPKLTSNYARLGSLLLHVEEGIWRLGVLRDIGMAPTMDLMVTPLENISIIFLKLDREQEAKLANNPLAAQSLGSVAIADSWRRLCRVVQDRSTEAKRGETVEAVMEHILSFFKENNLRSADGGSDETPQSSPGALQGFFFAMDVALTFSHRLDPREYKNILSYAIRFLEATEVQYDTPEKKELYKFYLAFAKHCRSNMGAYAEYNKADIRARFRLLRAFDLAKRSSEAKDHTSDEYNMLANWVKAYRLTNSAKMQRKGKTVAENGWLTRTSDAPEDQVGARPHTAYLDLYHEYCTLLGIKDISDAFHDSTHGFMGGPSRTGPWADMRVIDYLRRIRDRAVVDEGEWFADVLNDDDVGPTKASKLQRVSQRMSVLGRRILPSLAAVRYSLPSAPADLIAELCASAKEDAKFAPAYASWVAWRLSVYEDILTIIPSHSMLAADGTLQLRSDIRDLLRNETASSDQDAIVLLLEQFIFDDGKQRTLTLQDKQTALRLVDKYVNPDMPSRLQEKAEAVSQAILIEIIEDPDLASEAIRANCILRLRDVVWAAQMCSKYVDNWPEASLAMSVLLKCLNDIMPSHPLRSKIAFKYNVILIYQDLTTQLPKDKRDKFILERKDYAPIKRDDQMFIRKLYTSWCAFESACRSSLGKVLLMFLEFRLVSSASKLYELYKTGKALNEAFAFSLQSSVEEKIADLIEAATIAELFNPDPEFPQDMMKNRLLAMKRLKAVEPRKVFFISKVVVNYLKDPQTQFVVVEHANRFKLAQEALARGGSGAGADSKSSDMERIELKQGDLDWLNVMRTSTHMLVRSPQELQSDLGAFYRDPKKVARELLLRGRAGIMAKIMPVFAKPLYRGQELDRLGRVVAYPDTSCARNASKLYSDPEQEIHDLENKAVMSDKNFDPYLFVLSVAAEVLTLQFDSLGRDTGFAVFDMCLGAGKTEVVAQACLDVVNALSMHLGSHEHALFVVHLMKNVLTYFQAKLGKSPLPSLVRSRYEAYSRIVFTPAERAQVLGKQDAAAADDGRLPLLYALRRVRFSVDDLLPPATRDELGVDPNRARMLRDRLILQDKLQLARRVWSECEGRLPEHFDEEIGEKVQQIRTLCESFDAQE
jgi:hypothetical protein